MDGSPSNDQARTPTPKGRKKRHLVYAVMAIAVVAVLIIAAFALGTEQNDPRTPASNIEFDTSSYNIDQVLTSSLYEQPNASQPMGAGIIQYVLVTYLNTTIELTNVGNLEGYANVVVDVYSNTTNALVLSNTTGCDIVPGQMISLDADMQTSTSIDLNGYTLVVHVNNIQVEEERLSQN